MNILLNDLINGVQATASNADVTVVSVGNATGTTVNASGQLVIPGGLVQGTYAIQYRLCQKGHHALRDGHRQRHGERDCGATRRRRTTVRRCHPAAAT